MLPAQASAATQSPCWVSAGLHSIVGRKTVGRERGVPEEQLVI